MGPDVAHAGEAASYDIGAKVHYAFYTEGGQTDCFDFDPQTVLISTATCAATGDTSSHDLTFNTNLELAKAYIRKGDIALSG
ncbi:hypothetical protein ACN38_g9337 [Penicillium nordicum]|uniref:Uncharacterized protein n=1 Tax=Penicillium nordicum TaxID=229535 RepID=A0A0M9WCP4_9EURO|nr:hypothetical protein ACN38_g9337 [Penicillium nordicum]